MKIKIADLRGKITKAFCAKFSFSEAECIADYLLWAEMSGITTQGLVKMTGPEPLQNIQRSHEIRISRASSVSALVDGGANPAPLVTQFATDQAVTKARQGGIAIVGVRNTFSSNGSQAYYLEQIAKADLIGFMCSRSPASTTGFNSIDPLFGTNPLGYSLPTNDEPLVFDAATSAMTFYGLVLARARGETIPENVAINSNGGPTTDPSDAMAGALLPFDRSYKSSGLSLMVEMFAGPLVSSMNKDRAKSEQEWGTFVLAFSPTLLVELSDFKQSASDLLRIIRTSRPRSGDSAIRLPGERARAYRASSEESGEVEIDETIFQKINFQ